MTETASRAERSSVIDSARGLGILLVVLGHVNRGLQGAALTPAHGWSERLDSAVYAFHMPLFFFLSGLFLERAFRRTTRTFVGQTARRLVWPYLVWSVALVVLQHVAGSAANRAVAPSRLLLIVVWPISLYWFLWVLAVGQLLLLLASRAGLRAAAATIIALAVAIPITVLRLDLAFALELLGAQLVWLAAGWWIGGHRIAGVVDRLRARIRPPIGLLVVVIIATATAFLTRPAAALVGLPVAALCIAGTLIGVPVARWLSWLGARSLPVYLAHVFAIATIRAVLISIGARQPALHLLVELLAGVLVPLTLWLAAQSLPMLRLVFAWPQRANASPRTGSAGK